MRILYTLLLFIGLSILTSCQNKDNVFVLKGNINELHTDTLLLYNEYAPDGEIDTLIASNGKFSFKALLDTITPYTLLIDGHIAYPIYANKGISSYISGNANEIQSLKVEGGKDNEDLNTFKQSIQSSLSETEQIAAANQFIRNNPSSFCNLYLLETYFLRKDSIPYQQLNELIGSMNGTVQDAFYTRRINERIKHQSELRFAYLPSFTLREGDKLITPSNYFQKVLIIHFWASWSNASTASNQMLRNIYKQYKKEKAFDMLGISFDVDDKAWQEAIQTDSLQWKQIRETEGFHSPIAQNFGIEKVPSCFLIDINRRILAVNPTKEELVEKLKLTLEETKKTKNKK